MGDDFSQTVNLREKAERERRVAREAVTEGTSRPLDDTRGRQARGGQARKKTVIKKKAIRPGQTRAQAIDQVYGDTEENNGNGNLRQIERPEVRPSYEGVYKRVVAVLTVIIIVFGGYLYFIKGDSSPGGEEAVQGELWYSVDLVNGETYYGQVENTAADPVIIKNVYYDYDQINSGNSINEGSANLKLVKMGKETFGPESKMEVVRTQVLKMIPLREDSKVLKAILDHEG